MRDVKTRSVQMLLETHDEDFVHVAYSVIVGRPPDTGGFDHYVARVRRGISKSQIIAELASSRESRVFAPKLVGLKRLRRLQRMRRYLVSRKILEWIGMVEPDSWQARKLRAIENGLYGHVGAEGGGHAKIFLAPPASVEDAPVPNGMTMFEYAIYRRLSQAIQPA